MMTTQHQAPQFPAEVPVNPHPEPEITPSYRPEPEIPEPPPDPGIPAEPTEPTIIPEPEIPEVPPIAPE